MCQQQGLSVPAVHMCHRFTTAALCPRYIYPYTIISNLFLRISQLYVPIQLLSFCDWLVSLSRVSSEFIPVIACVRIPLPVNANPCRDTPHFLKIHSSVHGHLSRSYVLAVLNNAAVNMCTGFSLRHCLWFF